MRERTGTRAQIHYKTLLLSKAFSLHDSPRQSQALGESLLILESKVHLQAVATYNLKGRLTPSLPWALISDPEMLPYIADLSYT